MSVFLRGGTSGRDPDSAQLDIVFLITFWFEFRASTDGRETGDRTPRKSIHIHRRINYFALASVKLLNPSFNLFTVSHKIINPLCSFIIVHSYKMIDKDCVRFNQGIFLIVNRSSITVKISRRRVAIADLNKLFVSFGPFESSGNVPTAGTDH